MSIETFYYDNKIVRNFGYATVIWGVIGMLVGLIVAIQLAVPDFLHTEFTTFGRIRPLHTNAVIFAFVGNAIFMGAYYSLQRLLKARMFSDALSKIHFWGWQLIILSAVLTLPFGITAGKEYAELEWPIDIAITLIWVVFGINMIGTILRRRERHLYVAIWFYLATWVAVALLHIVNSMEMPLTLTKSYSMYAGVQDALVQWWYGHNAVAFFLTTPFLGLMYYYLPKAAGRPVYSYRLSIVHFWSLVFIYIWAGPHHLLYTALPDWAQTLGTVFSIMLIAPSWGGMINGLLTLRGAWDKVRTDPILKFFVVAVTAYGMATFEGPMMALKNINAISHYSDWTIAHVHIGGLGWNGFLTFGMLYWLIPKLYQTKIHSRSLANTHFWIGTLGILIYAVPIYIGGLMQSFMLKEFTDSGTMQYGNFLDTMTEMIPFYALRAVGGALYLTGALIMVFNLIKTARKGTLLAQEKAEAPALEKNPIHKPDFWHRWIERRPMQMLVLSFLLLLVGTIIEIVPTFLIESNVPTIASVQPYTPLELEGRDIYISEGCYNCHSQMIRPFRSETERYGEYSKAGEFVYDHPYQWGSKRTGPDLHRIGGKYPDSWHYWHMWRPSEMSLGSNMPTYPHLFTKLVDTTLTPRKISLMRTLGVPYPEGFEDEVHENMRTQASEIAVALKKERSLPMDEDTGERIEPNDKTEIIALIAYLQRMGTDIKKKPAAPQGDASGQN